MLLLTMLSSCGGKATVTCPDCGGDGWIVTSETETGSRPVKEQRIERDDQGNIVGASWQTSSDRSSSMEKELCARCSGTGMVKG